MLSIAADMLEASPHDLELAGGKISVRGSAARPSTFTEVARRACHEPQLLPDGVEPGLESDTPLRGARPGELLERHARRPRRGRPGDRARSTILDYAVVEDCGTIVNPTIVEGQIHGGVAQGIGGALLEHLAYDERGQLVTTSFMDYLLPTTMEVPDDRRRPPGVTVPEHARGLEGHGRGRVDQRTGRRSSRPSTTPSPGWACPPRTTLH